MLVGVVKELDSGIERQSNQSVRSRPATDIRRQRTAEPVLYEVGFFQLLQNPAPVLPGARILAPDRGKGEHCLGRDQPLRIFRNSRLKFAQEQQREFGRDAAR